MIRNIALGLSLFVTLNSMAFAHESKEGNHPCKKVKEACQAAGFTKGAHKENGKGLFMDCMKPLREGKTVEGVTIAPADLNACKAKKEAHKHE
jgi:hypothetical protein